MAVTFAAAGALGHEPNATSVTLVAPTVLDGDVLIAQLLTRSSLVNTVSPPDGSWTEIIQGDLDPVGLGNDIRYALYWKHGVAADSGANFVFTRLASDANFIGVISAWSGSPNPGNPLDATAITANEGGASDAVSFNSFDPAGACHVIFFAWYIAAITTTAFAAAMSADTNPDCTTRYDLEQGTQMTLACTSGDSDGSNIAARTWASNSTNDGFWVGVRLGLTSVAPPASSPQTPSGRISTRSSSRERIRH